MITRYNQNYVMSINKNYVRVEPNTAQLKALHISDTNHHLQTGTN